MHARPRRFTDTVSLLQQVHHWCHDGRARQCANAQHHLLPPRCGAHQLACLQVLQIVTGHGRGIADHRTDEHYRHGAAADVVAQQCQQDERGEEDSGDGDAGDRVIRGTHQTGHIAADGAEEEARHHHDDGHGERYAHGAHHEIVKNEQGHHEQCDARHDQRHGQVLLGMRYIARRLRALRKTTADAGAQRISQGPQRP